MPVLNESDEFLILAAVGSPETADKIIEILENSSSGSVTGPVSSTDNALVRFSGTGGNVVKNSSVIVADSGNISGIAALSAQSANLSGLAISRALVTDGSKNLASSNATAAEVEFLSGVTSNIQTQLNAKVGAASPTFTGNVLVDTGLSGISNFAVTGRCGTATGFVGFQLTNSTGSAFFHFRADFDTGNENMTLNTENAGTLEIMRVFRGGQTWFRQVGSAAVPALAVGPSVNTGFYSVGVDVIGLSTAGVLRFQVDNTGIATFANQTRVASLGVANSALATTPGTVVRKIEVFDASGGSLGFIPVYDAIT